jgi:hypothetical protein
MSSFALLSTWDICPDQAPTADEEVEYNEGKEASLNSREINIEDGTMKIEIIEKPIRFHLYGVGGVVENERYGEVGLRLMNEMWQVVKAARMPTTGINHWVYLPDGKLFVGVEVKNAHQITAANPLESLEFELARHMKYVHIGPYQALPQKWKELQTELAARGEITGSPSLEIYGHHCNDSSKLETTILMGLQKKP